MRLKAACLLGLVLASAVPAQALDDKRLAWERHDTRLHLGVAFGASFLATELLEWKKVPAWKATLLGSLAVLTAGAVKEYAFDSSPSGSDLMADSVGVGANAGLQFAIHFGGPKEKVAAQPASR